MGARAIPFHSIADPKARERRDEIWDAIISVEMKVIGFVTDSKGNSIRTQGSKQYFL